MSKKLRLLTGIITIFCGVFLPSVTSHAYSSISEISQNLINTGRTMTSYVEGANAILDEEGNYEWRFGEVYDATGKRTLTNGLKYCYDRLTFTPSRPHNDSDKGDVIFNGVYSPYIRDYLPNNTGYIPTSTPPLGYHFYYDELEEGTQIPLAGWINTRKDWNAVHSESGWDVDAVPIGANKGLINPARYGRWAMYNGVEFHAATSRVQTVPNEKPSPCYKTLEPFEFNQNSTAWNPVCAVCGEIISNGNIYASIEAVSCLPILEEGAEIMHTCPTCGGLENYIYIHHTCRFSSANKYTISYHIGTNDPSAYGVTPSSTWYYNFATKYNGNPVTSQDMTVAPCNYTRPGYTFAGWSLTYGGAVAIQPGADLRRLQPYLPSYDDGASLTLYAVWTANTSYLKIDANTSAFGGGALYNGATVWQSNAIGYKNSSHQVNVYTINPSYITLPRGYTVSFSGNGGSAGISSITATTSFIGCNLITSNANGFFDATTKRYYFGPNNRTANQADIIRLEYKQNAIKLPSASKSNASFIGWYSDAACTQFIGSAGSDYFPTGNITLYARYEEMQVKVSEVYYKRDAALANSFENIAKDSATGKALNDFIFPNNESYAVHNATGAAHLYMKMFTPNGYRTVYKPQYRLSGSTWIDLETAESASPASPNVYDASYTEKGTYTYTVQSSGFYQINTYGAQGGNYGTNVGGYGGQAYATFYLEKGEVITITNGGQDGTNGGGTGTVYGNGGGYSVVSSNKKGTLLIAGGGGGAGAEGNGGAGGGSTGLRADNANAGQGGQTGGGGGYVGGNAGEAGEIVRHNHVDDCYKDKTTSAPSSTYTNSTAATTNTAGYGTGLKTGDGFASVQSHSQLGYSTLSLTTGVMNTSGAGYINFNVVNNGYKNIYEGLGQHGTDLFDNFTVIVYENGTHTKLYEFEGTTAAHTTTVVNSVYCDKADCILHKRPQTTWQYTATGVTGTRFFQNSYSFQKHSDDSWSGVHGSDHYTLQFKVPVNTSRGVYVHLYMKVPQANDGDGNWMPATIYNMSYTTKEVDCGYTDGEILSQSPYKPGYGGSSYINTSFCQANTYNSTAGQKSGNGATYITGINIGMVDGSSNEVQLLAIKTPDITPPGAITNVDIQNNGSTRTISWNAPTEERNTRYDFRVSMYEVPTTGTTLTLKKTVDNLYVEIDTAIAGYYYIFDNSASTDVAGYVNARFAKPAYTWSNSYYTGVGFTQSNSLTFTPTTSWLHIAAVDVAGNIGPSFHQEFAKTNLCCITFDTNHLEYQLNPGQTVDCGVYTAVGKTTSASATGKNKQNAFYRGYYSVDGTNVANNNKGTFDGTSFNVSFGGAFPIPSATGCVFVGWNSKKDGTGIYYSADGSNIGASYITDTVLIPKNILGSNLYGQEITLYAIWSEPSDIPENTVSSSVIKTYDENSLSIINGRPVINTVSKDTASSTSAIWSNKTSVTTKAKFTATGVYAMSQHLLALDGKRVATVNYYMGGAGNTLQKCVLDRIITTNDSLGELIWNKNEDAKAVNFTSNGSTALRPDSLYSSTEKSLNVEYRIQGSYKVYGSAISRAYISSDVLNSGMQGYPAFSKTEKVTLKLDATIPKITSHTTIQETLNGVPSSQIAAKASGDLNTTFRITASDYNDSANGATYNTSDSSGIKGAYVLVEDFEDPSKAKIYTMTCTQSTNTLYDNHVLTGSYELKVNLYKEFPDSALLSYKIFVIDNAGNMSMSASATQNIGNSSSNRETSEQIHGFLKNFTAATFIYNDEDAIFNIADNEVYFQTGSTGHVEVWVVGCADSVQFDFKGMGTIAKEEIQAGNLQASLNLGILEPGWTRILPASISTNITGASSNGKPLVQRYHINGWESNGTSILIPPGYQLTPNGRLNDDGTPQYYWELHNYDVLVKKGNQIITVSGSYILWSDKSTDVHYRVYAD